MQCKVTLSTQQIDSLACLCQDIYLHDGKVTEPFLGRAFIRRSRYHEYKMGTRKWLTDDMKKYLKR